MNEKQKKFVKQKIKGDCAIRHQYFDPKDPSRCCAIGSFIPKTLVRLVIDGGYNGVNVRDLPAKVLKAIQSSTGLSLGELSQMQKTNDWERTVRGRRKYLLDLVNDYGHSNTNT